MGVRTLSDRDDEHACMYCSVTDWAFGPVFYDEGEHTAADRIEMFLEWLRKTGRDDPRKYEDSELERVYTTWRMQEEQQWKDKEEADKLRYNYDDD